jgi:hypothetical protein
MTNFSSIVGYDVLRNNDGSICQLLLDYNVGNQNFEIYFGYSQKNDQSPIWNGPSIIVN